MEDFTTFYIQRIRRILPIYLIILNLITIFLYAAIWREDIGAIVGLLNATVFVKFIPINEWDEKMFNTFYHCWAITIHLQYSLIFPVIGTTVLRYNMFQKNKTNILLILICINLTFLPLLTLNSFWGRSWQFAVGILAFQNPIPKKWSYFWVFALIIFVLSIIPWIPQRLIPLPLDVMIVGLCGTVLAFKNEFFLEEIPNFFIKIVFHLGDISLILYMISWPAINYCKYIFNLPVLNVYGKCVSLKWIL